MAQALRYLQHAVTQSQEAVLMTDAAGIIFRVNPAFERLTGHSSIQAVGKDVSSLIAGGPQSEDYRRLWARIFSQRTFTGQVQLVSRSSEKFSAEIVATPVLNTHGHIAGLVCTLSSPHGAPSVPAPALTSLPATDSTSRTRELARDVNQHLLPVLANAELTLESLPSESPLRARLRVIRNGARRATEIIRPWLDQDRPELQGSRELVSTPAEDRGPSGTLPATVLVINAESGAHEGVTEQLSKYGYKVIVARSTEDALVAARSSPIDLVIAEIMPEVTGQEFTKRFTALNPEIKVLFVSGCAPSAPLWRDAPGLNRSFLQKPFSLTALVEKVGHVLSRPEKARAAAASTG
jgi:PAS domain S-box-containing protein